MIFFSGWDRISRTVFLGGINKAGFGVVVMVPQYLSLVSVLVLEHSQCFITFLLIFSKATFSLAYNVLTHAIAMKTKLGMQVQAFLRAIHTLHNRKN